MYHSSVVYRKYPQKKLLQGFLLQLELASASIAVKMACTVYLHWRQWAWASVTLDLGVRGSVLSMTRTLSGDSGGMYGPADGEPCVFVDQSDSLTWHQLNRRIVSDPTNFILYKLLKLPHGNLVSRYSALTLHFFISGILHAAIDIASGIPWRSSGAVRFFCTQVLGIMLEEIAQAIYFSAFGRFQLPSSPALWSRCLGYVWLVIFLSWSVPTWLYPMLYRTRSGMQDSVLPFSLIRALIAMD